MGSEFEFWNIAAQMAKAVCDFFNLNILDIVHATSALTPVMITNPSGMIHISLSLEGVRENATWRQRVIRLITTKAHLGEEQRGGEERDIDDIELALRCFVGDTSRSEDIPCETEKKDLRDGLLVWSALPLRRAPSSATLPTRPTSKTVKSSVLTTHISLCAATLCALLTRNGTVLPLTHAVAVGCLLLVELALISDGKENRSLVAWRLSSLKGGEWKSLGGGGAKQTHGQTGHLWPSKTSYRSEFRACQLCAFAPTRRGHASTPQPVRPVALHGPQLWYAMHMLSTPTLLSIT